MHAVQTFQSNGLSRLNRGGSGLEFPKNKNKEGIYKFESIHFFKKNITLAGKSQCAAAAGTVGR